MSSTSPVVLGLHYGHNATVALAIDGEVVAVLSEERTSRLKNAVGMPATALAAVLELGAVTAADIDSVVVTDGKLQWYRRMLREGHQAHGGADYFWRAPTFQRATGAGQPLMARLAAAARSRVGAFVRRRAAINRRDWVTPERVGEAQAFVGKLVGVPAERVRFVDHHTAHAMTPIAFTGGDVPALVFTLDGMGDDLCASVRVWDPQTQVLRELSTTPARLSLGLIYRQVTGYLGMKPDEHEYKVMGLAPYAEPGQVARVSDVFRSLLWLGPDGAFVGTDAMDDIDAYLKSVLAYERFDVIAGALQSFTEDLIVSWVRHWVERERIGEVYVSGGVFMNVKATQDVAAIEAIDRLFVTPSAGDESLPIGACLIGHLALGGARIVPVQDLYLGRPIELDGLDAFFEGDRTAERYDIERLDESEMIERVVQLLAAGEIVSIARGREEWGARALGNRSIWCRPDDLALVRELNHRIKSRDFWMPFAPAITEERVSDFIAPETTETCKYYMSIATDTTAKGRDALRAASHPFDGSIRPQVVRQDWNPFYHGVIEGLGASTGVFAVLNTSFNLHGEPIVGGPADALHTVDESALRHLVLGDRLLTKR